MEGVWSIMNPDNWTMCLIGVRIIVTLLYIHTRCFRKDFTVLRLHKGSKRDKDVTNGML